MCSFIQLLCKNVRHRWNQVLKRCYQESGFLHPLAHLSSSSALSPGRPSLCKWQMAFSHSRPELLSAPWSQGEDRKFLSPKVSSTSSRLASVLCTHPSRNQSRRPERWRSQTWWCGQFHPDHVGWALWEKGGGASTQENGGAVTWGWKMTLAGRRAFYHTCIPFILLMGDGIKKRNSVDCQGNISEQVKYLTFLVIKKNGNDWWQQLNPE